MMYIKDRYEDGSAKAWMIATISLIVLVTGLLILAVWLYMNYSDQKNNVDSKVDVAIAVAKKEQADSDEVKFSEREKEPNRQFVGPDDYGRVTFSYPKTWSVYVNDNASNGGTYEAYLNPITVPPVSSTQQFAVRVTIQEEGYDKVLSTYDTLIKRGNLASSSVSANGNSGTRFDGNFTKDIRGSAVVFKVRDKTLTVRTDANTFTADFNALIATIKFNQ